MQIGVPLLGSCAPPAAATWLNTSSLVLRRSHSRDSAEEHSMARLTSILSATEEQKWKHAENAEWGNGPSLQVCKDLIVLHVRRNFQKYWKITQLPLTFFFFLISPQVYIPAEYLLNQHMSLLRRTAPHRAVFFSLIAISDCLQLLSLSTHARTNEKKKQCNLGDEKSTRKYSDSDSKEVEPLTAFDSHQGKHTLD